MIAVNIKLSDEDRELIQDIVESGMEKQDRHISLYFTKDAVNMTIFPAKEATLDLFDDCGYPKPEEKE